MDFSEYVYYDETSPSCLRWKVKTGRKVVIGAKAGSKHTHAWGVRIMRKRYLAHRVIYEILIGKIPDGYDIDHIDRNPHNNKLSNLRAVPHWLNMRNLSLREDTRSGVTGVHYKEIYDKRADYTYTGWRAEWRDLSGKNCTKLFSTRKYGDCLAFQLAREHREKMISELNERGAGYSPTHGK